MTDLQLTSKKNNILHLKGSPHDLGIQHGEKLSTAIKTTCTLYKNLFAPYFKRTQDLIDQCHVFRNVIHEHRPNYGVEIDAIATGAKLDRWMLYMLNARTEILNQQFVQTQCSIPQECTSISLSDTALLAQNWDWIPEMQSLATILHIEKESGHRILMLTEPGIIGKIGLNSSGIGTCLNILFNEQNTCGLPIHILLRDTLEKESLAQAIDNLSYAPQNTTSHIMIASARNGAYSIEFADGQIYKNFSKEPIAHTNHYLWRNKPQAEWIAGSQMRLTTALEFIEHSTAQTPINQVKALLADESCVEAPIFRPFKKEAGMTIGTVFSIIIDLKNQQLLLSKPKAKNKYDRYSLGD